MKLRRSASCPATLLLALLLVLASVAVAPADAGGQPPHRHHPRPPRGHNERRSELLAALRRVLADSSSIEDDVDATTASEKIPCQDLEKTRQERPHKVLLVKSEGRTYAVVTPAMQMYGRTFYSGLDVATEPKDQTSDAWNDWYVSAQQLQCREGGDRWRGDLVVVLRDANKEAHFQHLVSDAAGKDIIGRRRSLMYGAARRTG